MEWTLERAKNRFSEVVRLALAHQPQVVVRGGRDSVVVVSLDDFQRLAEPPPLVEFLRQSPLAEAVACGELHPDAFVRDPDPGRDVVL